MYTTTATGKRKRVEQLLGPGMKTIANRTVLTSDHACLKVDDLNCLTVAGLFDANSRGMKAAARGRCFIGSDCVKKALFARALLLLLFVFVATPPAHGMAEAKKQIYSMPISETEDVISGWLRRMGFQLYSNKENHGGITLFGEKGTQRWQIRLIPHSPLATKVDAQFAKRGVPCSVEVEKLWIHLSNDIQANGIPAEDIPASHLNRINEQAPSAPSPPEIWSKRTAVVCIHGQRSEAPLQISGFIIDSGGLIISTAHGLQYLEPVIVALNDGRSLPGRVIKIDHNVDLTLIDVNASLKTAISLDQGRNMLQQGEQLYNIGCPADMGVTIYSGHISGPPRKLDRNLLWQANITIHPGSSGSPVFDTHGSIVAVVKGRYRGTDSVGFLIPFESLMNFIDSP